MNEISNLWLNGDEAAWQRALRHYWRLIPDRARELEERLSDGVLERVKSCDKQEWFGFLFCEYFPWKYTAKNRLVTTRMQLLRHAEDEELEKLEEIRSALLSMSHDAIEEALTSAAAIRGLGTAGASGLLALIYPQYYGTVDQFIVKALREVEGLEQQPALEAMNPEGLSTSEGAVLIRILRAKAAENNARFNKQEWTPRKIDQVLWAVGRGDGLAADGS